MTNTPEHCQNCGSTNIQRVATIQFKGKLLEVIEKMASRRGEDLGEFIMHLLWLESGKKQALRDAFMDALRHSHHEHKKEGEDHPQEEWDDLRYIDDDEEAQV